MVVCWTYNINLTDYHLKNVTRNVTAEGLTVVTQQG